MKAIIAAFVVVVVLGTAFGLWAYRRDVRIQEKACAAIRAERVKTGSGFICVTPDGRVARL